MSHSTEEGASCQPARLQGRWGLALLWDLEPLQERAVCALEKLSTKKPSTQVLDTVGFYKHLLS